MLIEGGKTKSDRKRKELTRSSEISCLDSEFKLSRFSWGQFRG